MFLIEKFEQAIADYTAALNLKTALLPITSRQIAEAHYKLSIVLDLTSGRLKDAILHAEKAVVSLEARISEIKQRLATSDNGTAPVGNGKGKGKQKASGPDDIANMTKVQMEGELKELAELINELSAKVRVLSRFRHVHHFEFSMDYLD